MSEIKVRTLEWHLEEPNWWSTYIGEFGFGYEVRVTDSGAVRARRGATPFFTFEGSAEEAKASFQQDFEQRVRGCLEPGEAA